jgi:protein kinase-like protein
MTCPSCGAAAAADAVLCGGCGAELPAPREGDPLVGTLLAGRYRVLDRLGQGGFGAVYRAEQVSMGREVAVKVLHRALARDAHVIGRFRREARTACRLRDPHTVITHDFGETEDGTLYLVMELLFGKRLLDLLAQGPLPAARAVRIAEQVCQSLAEAHAAGIVHRDIKAENVMVEDRPGEPDFVKVLDFGIAKIVEGDEGEKGPPRITGHGQTVGTVEAMPPEQLRGERLDGRTDLYAVGVLLYRMLCGRPPFVGIPASVISAHLEHRPQPPRALRPDIPEALEAVVLDCLAKDPAGRPPSARALREELRAGLAQGLASTALAAAVGRRSRIALVALGVLAAGLLAVVLARRHEPRSPATPLPMADLEPSEDKPLSPVGRAHEIFAYAPADMASAIALDLEALRASALGPNLDWLIDPDAALAPQAIDRLLLVRGEGVLGLGALRLLAGPGQTGRALFVARTNLPQRAVERAFDVRPGGHSLRCGDAEYFHAGPGHLGFLSDGLVFGAGRDPVCPDLGDRPLAATAAAVSLLAHAGYRGKPGPSAVGYARMPEREIAFALDHPGGLARVRAAARPSDCSDLVAIRAAIGLGWKRPPDVRAAPGSEPICLLTYSAGQ